MKGINHFQLKITNSIDLEIFSRNVTWEGVDSSNLKITFKKSFKQSIPEK
jgi:hypothetical protein